MLLYTSGSTADPKGCIHSQGTVVRQSFVVTSSYCITGDDVVFSSMPFFWIGGLVTVLHACQHHGATVVTQPSFEPAGALMRAEHAGLVERLPDAHEIAIEHERPVMIAIAHYRQPPRNLRSRRIERKVEARQYGLGFTAHRFTEAPL